MKLKTIGTTDDRLRDALAHTSSDTVILPDYVQENLLPISARVGLGRYYEIQAWADDLERAWYRYEGAMGEN